MSGYGDPISRFLRSKRDGRYLTFWCPGCKDAHVVPVAPGVINGWGYNGDPDRPTFTPSYLLNGPGPHHAPHRPTCHSHLTDGRIQFLPDCTHALAGQTVDLPEFPK